MSRPPSLSFLIALLLISSTTACGSGGVENQTEISPTVDVVQTGIAGTLMALPTNTVSPTFTNTPTFTPTETETLTPIPTIIETPTSTLAPQFLAISKRCGIYYSVRTGQSIMLYYAGWGVRGQDLAQQWASNLTAILTIDGVQVAGSQQGPSKQVPYSCSTMGEDVYAVYYRAFIPNLAPGQHNIGVKLNALGAMSDGDQVYGPGLLFEQAFLITAK